MTVSPDITRPPRGGDLVEDSGTRKLDGPSYHISDAIVDYLYDTGFIDRVNDRFDIIIDVFEEALASADILPEILTMLDEEIAKVRRSDKQAIAVKPSMGHETEIPRVELERALNGMRDFMTDAARKHRGVWFAF